MSEGATRRSVRRPLTFGIGFWVVGVALLCAAAQAVIVDEDYEVGSGPSFFQVALIADVHDKWENLEAARDTINSLVDANHPIQMVIVLGDLTNVANPDVDLPEAKRVLDDLAVPYVPLIGNHDMVPYYFVPRVPPRDQDSLFTTRYFNSVFNSVYETLAAGAYPQIWEFRRYREHPWNFGIHWPWPLSDTFAYDIWQNFTFRVGPPLSPYRFVCLDFNSRDKLFNTWPNGLPYDTMGMWPYAVLHKLPLDNQTSSIKVRGGTQMLKCVVFDSTFFRGDSLPVYNNVVNLGAWNDRISSVRVVGGCTLNLYAAADTSGDVWLRLNADDQDLGVNGPEQWWRDSVRAFCMAPTGDTVRDNVIFFAHHPLMSVDPGFSNFAPGEVEEISSFLAPYADDVGGWYGGHIVDSGKWYSPPFHGEVTSGDTKVCNWYIVPETNHYGGYVKILTLYYGKPPLVDQDLSGLIDDTVDVTYEDSIPVVVKTLRLGSLTARVEKGTRHVATLCESVSVGPGSTVNLFWDGKDSAGGLALPDDDYFVRYYDEEGFHAGASPFTVKGTCLPASQVTSVTWDTLHEPYVLAGHNFSLSDSATLTISPGVRVMFHDLSPVNQGIYGIYVNNNCRLEAFGNLVDSVFFMPHRRMALATPPQVSGYWGEIFLEEQSYGAMFNYCVFENGGCAPNQAVLYAHSSESPHRISICNCHFVGAKAHAVSDTGTARRADIDFCVFENGGDFPLYAVKAPDVGRVSATCVFVHNGHNNKYNGIVVEAGGNNHIASTDTWHLSGEDFFYKMNDGNLTIRPHAGDTAVLHIKAGVKLRFGGTKGMIAENGGAIIAEGTPGAPIVFEGIDGASWQGLEVQSGPSSFTDCVFRDGVGDKADDDWDNSFDYYPMLYINNASPTVHRCQFLDAYRDSVHERGTGIYIKDGQPSIKRCVFISNEAAILGKFSGLGCIAESCHITGGEVGYLVTSMSAGAGGPYAGLKYSNIFAHYDSGVVNRDVRETLYARHNCWGPDSNGLPGRLNNDTAYGKVWIDSALTHWVPILGHDAQAVSIVRPPVDMEPREFVPAGVAQNNCCDEETLTVTMSIGTVYADTVRRAFPFFSSDTVEFRPCTLDVDTYPVVFKVTLAYDSIPANDSLVRTVNVAWFSGWEEMYGLPPPPSGKKVRDGGCMAYDSSSHLIYASKGNKTGDFYAHNTTTDAWTQKWGIPLGAEGKQVYKGSVICSDGNGKLYLTKGNNTLGFWEYDAAQNAWTQDSNVPLGPSKKKVKQGAGLAWATHNDAGFVYLLKGYRNEFYRYDPEGDTWKRLLDAPIGPGNHYKWDDGSWLVFDGDHLLYALKGKYNELYVYDTDADTWSPAKSPMPLNGSTGKRKKAGMGSCAAWFGDKLYALKGYNTTEFWRYLPGVNSWQLLEDIPLVGGDGERKTVKAGGALAGDSGTGVFAFKGNKSLQFWRYIPARESGGSSGLLSASRGGAVQTPGGQTLGGELPLMDGLEASKPHWNWQGTMVCYSKTDTLTEREQIYQCPYGSSSSEQRVVDMDEDCEEPVFSPDGQYIAFQLDDTVSGFYQLCVTPTSDTGIGGGGGPCGKNEASQAPACQADATGPASAVAPVTEVTDQASTTKPPAVTRRAVTAAQGIPGSPATLGLVLQITYAEADHCYPEWSPNGMWLCYERDDENGYTQVWRVPAFGGTEQQLTFDNADHFLPSYLTQNEIVFTLSSDVGYDQIAKVNVSTLQVTTLSTFDTDHDKPSPAWNGASVAAEALDDYCNTQIVRMGAAGETWLTSGDADIMEPDFGQDNQTIFAVRWTGITSQIVQVDGVNGGYTAVTDSLAIRDNPDTYVDSFVSNSMAVYEREEWIAGGSLLGGRGKRKHGSGVYLSKSHKKHHPLEGAQGASIGVFALDNAKPNPATSRVAIRWQVPVEAEVSLRVYNTAGQLVKVLASGKTKPGAYTSIWNGTDAKGRRLANGVYFYALDNGVKRISRKVILTQ